MKPRTTISLALCFTAMLQAQISAPRVGVARYGDGTVRAIYGLAADYVIGKQAIRPADVISFSDSAGLISRAGNIQLIGQDGSLVAEYESGETAPVLNVDGDLKTALAWLPSRRALLHWDGRAFVLTRLSSAFSEAVTSLRLQSPTSVQLLLLGTGKNVFEASVSLHTGDLTSLNLLPGVAGPAFLQGFFVVFHDPAGLEIQSPNGSLRTLPLSASDLSFERMSSDTLHLASATTKEDWALHLNASVLELAQLPALPESAK